MKLKISKKSKIRSKLIAKEKKKFVMKSFKGSKWVCLILKRSKSKTIWPANTQKLHMDSSKQSQKELSPLLLNI